MSDLLLQAYGMNINNEQLASLERITLGFNNEEVKKYFTKPDIDTVGAISNYIEWSLIEVDIIFSFFILHLGHGI